MILEEYEITNTLSDVTRRIMVGLVVEFLRKLFGNNPEKAAKSAAATAIIELFPALAVKDSTIGGSVSLKSHSLCYS